jgi:tetratricopeptide (TPR) repeat protein
VIVVKTSRWILGVVMLLSACQVSLFEPYFQAAERLYVAGNFEQAIQLYIKAIGQNSRRPESYFGLAMAYYRLGYLEEAQLAFEKTLEQDPQNVFAYERLAAVNLDLGHADTAIYLCRLARIMDGKFVAAVNTLGHAYVEAGKIDSAEKAFLSAVNLCRDLNAQSRASANPLSYAADESEAFNGLGEVYIAKGLYTHALDYFGAAISLTPNWDTPWFNKAITYETLTNFSAAQVAYRRTIDLAPNNLVAHRSFARLLVRLRKEQDAIDLYRKALRVDPHDTYSYYGLADICERRGEYAEAAEAYKGILESSPDDPVGYLRAGSLEMKRDEFDEAAKMFQSALDLRPGFSEAYNGLGEAYRAKGLVAQAQTAFEAAIKNDSTLAVAFRNLGSVLLDQHREEEGIAMFHRAASFGDPNAREFLRARGIAWEKK